MLRTALSESITSAHFPLAMGGRTRVGQVTEAQTQFALAQLVRLLAPARVLEIGTFFGDTARVIAATMAQIGGHLTTIDPFGADRVPDLIAGWPQKLRDRVTFRPDNSMSFFLYLDEYQHVGRGKDAPFELIFVDGHHSFDYAFFDLMRSSLFLRPGGVLVVDNVEQPGPAEAVRFFLDRHTHWHLFQVADGPPRQELNFHPTANSAIIFAPDGIEIGPLPYRIDLYGLPAPEIAKLQVKVRSRGPGTLRVLVNFYSRPPDYSVTGVGEQGRIGVSEQKLEAGEVEMLAVMYEPPLKLSPQPRDQIAAQIELSFMPEGKRNLLVESDPVTIFE
jgi:predicted O-methyltransferase YrrM